MVPSDFKCKNPDFYEVYQANIKILTKFIKQRSIIYWSPTLGESPRWGSLPVGGVSPLGESPRRGSLPVGRVYNPDLQKRESLCQGAIDPAWPLCQKSQLGVPASARNSRHSRHSANSTNSGLDFDSWLNREEQHCRAERREPSRNVENPRFAFGNIIYYILYFIYYILYIIYDILYNIYYMLDIRY